MSTHDDGRPLTGQVAMVTGGASGIGRATVLSLAAAGAALAVVDRDRAGAEHVAKEARDLGSHAASFVADLADVARLARLVGEVITTFSRIDILVNCAGMSGVSGEMQSSLTFSDTAFEAVIATNMRAPYVLTREVGNHMMLRGDGGRIVNVSSSAAFQARGVPALYAGTKAAINALTRVSAADLAPYGVNVNAVAPGVTKTPMMGASLTDEQYDAIVSSGPFENLSHCAAAAEDVAAVIRFLCLPESKEITGQVIHTSAGAIV
jgi:NAD(P)-dependent dehydrogenase (short-subunit alcohol dehydrogenase family)